MPARSRLRRDAVQRRVRFVVVALVDDVGHGQRRVDEAGVFVVGPLLHQDAAQVRVAHQPVVTLRRREVAQRLPRRVSGERVGRGLQAPGHADGPAADLAVDLEPGLARLVDLRARLAPQLGRIVDLQQQDRERPAGGFGGRAQDLELAGAEVGVDLDHAAARPLHRGGEAEQLRLARRQAGREAAVLGLVLDRARGGEAERAGVERLLQQIAHARDLVVGRHGAVVGSALAHHVEAQRGVRHLRADVHDLGRLCRARPDTRGRIPS